MEILYYQTSLGVIPVRKYIFDLSKNEQSLIQATLGILEDRGIENTVVHLRPIEGKLWEIKVAQHRIFYVLINGPIMVLLHAYKKESQKAPPVEIKVAKRRMKEVLAYFDTTNERRK